MSTNILHTKFVLVARLFELRDVSGDVLAGTKTLGVEAKGDCIVPTLHCDHHLQ